MTQVPPGDMFTRRVCLQLEGMEAVSVRRDLRYGSPDDPSRLMDVYYPSEPRSAAGWPVVVIVPGYPGDMEPRPTPLTFKELGWTTSMAQLVARSGMVAIAYTNRGPVQDLERLLDHVNERSASLDVDPSRVAVLASSGHVPTALNQLMNDAKRPPRCAVFEYGCLLDLEGASDVADAARQFGFVNACAGRSMSDLRRDIPLFIARAGRDRFPAMNRSIDRFVGAALADNLPLTLVNHAEGPHGFDLFDDSDRSREVVQAVLDFLAHHLGVIR